MTTTAEVSLEQLVRWAAQATLCDSYMSLAYHRSGIKQWDTLATPKADEWLAASTRARRTAEELVELLMARTGRSRDAINHAVGAEMRRLPWERSFFSMDDAAAQERTSQPPPPSIETKK